LVDGQIFPPNPFCKMIVSEVNDNGDIITKHENKTKSRTATFNPKFKDAKFSYESLSVAGGMPKVEFIVCHSENDSPNWIELCSSDMNLELKPGRRKSKRTRELALQDIYSPDNALLKKLKI
jgi:hypothetical protein